MRHTSVSSILSLLILSILVLGQTGQCGSAPLATGDRDGDSIADSVDNCPDAANLDQLDSDDDGIGNACENSSSGSQGGGWTDPGTDPGGSNSFPESNRRCGVWSGTITVDTHRVRDWRWDSPESYGHCWKVHSGKQDERTTANINVLLGDSSLWSWEPAWEADGEVKFDEVNTSHIEGFESKCLLLQDETEELHDSWTVDAPQIDIHVIEWAEGFNPRYYYDFDVDTLTFQPFGERTVDVTVVLIVNPPNDGQQVHLTTTYTGVYQCSGNGIPDDEDTLVDHPGMIYLELKGTYYWDPNGGDRLIVNVSDDEPKIFDCTKCSPTGSCFDSQSTTISYEIHLTRFPEADRDNDDVCDSIDNCPDTPNSDQRDVTGDGIGDECDPLAPLVP